MSIGTATIVIAICNILLVIITWYYYKQSANMSKRALKESWKNTIITSASDCLGELEKLRTKHLSNVIKIDPEICGKCISHQQRLKFLLFKNPNLEKTMKLLEELIHLADVEKNEDSEEHSFKKYEKKEDEFLKIISSALD